MKILALDLGKFNTMCCFFDTKTRKHSFLNAATDRNYLATIFKQHKIDLVVMEACGPSGWINWLVTKQAATLDTEPRAKSYSGGSHTHLSSNHFQYAHGPICSCGNFGVRVWLVKLSDVRSV